MIMTIIVHFSWADNQTKMMQTQLYGDRSMNNSRLKKKSLIKILGEMNNETQIGMFCSST